MACDAAVAADDSRSSTPRFILLPRLGVIARMLRDYPVVVWDKVEVDPARVFSM